jgi:DNA repair exonuclease SbcCD ATPase subunit
MLPLYFTLENFKTHKYTEIDCTQFESVVILGRNKNNARRANAIGKSSIFDAIDFALFNYADVNLDKIVRFGTDKCKVTFSFESSGNVYRITRGRSKSGKADLKLEQNVQDKWTDLTAKTASETEIEISKIIRISHVAFRSSILFAQGDMQGLAAAKPADRKLLLKEPLQLNEYGKYEKKAKEKASALNKEYESIKTRIGALGSPAEEIAEHKSKIATVQQSISENDLLIKEQQVTADRLKQQIAVLLAAETQPNKLLEELENAKKSKNSLSVKLTGLIATHKNLVQQQSQAEERIAQARVKLKICEQEKVKLSAIEFRNKEQIESDLKSFASKEIEGKVFLAKLDDAKVKLQKPITSADLCEACEQPVTLEHRKTCEEARIAKLQKNAEDRIKYSKILENVQNKKRAFETELNAVLASAQTLSNLDSQISFQNKTISVEEPLLLERASNINSLLLEKKDVEESHSNCELKVVELQKSLQEALQSSKQEEISKIQTALTDLVGNIENVRSQNSQLIMTVGSLSQKIESCAANCDLLQKLQISKIDLEKRLNRIQRIAKGFSSSGIPSMIINTILDDLQINTNDLLAQIRPEMEAVFSIVKTKDDGKQEDTLDISYRVHGEPHEYKQLSGGQKVMVSFCLRLALSLVIQHRIGVDIKFLELDEVDMPFDDEGLEAFVEIIKKWQKKLKIMLISHNKYVQSKFTQAIVVESEDRFCSFGKLVSL